jgi:chromosome segregation ATPase
MRKIFVMLVSGVLVAGCSAYGPEELDRLTKEDPAFRQMILARDQMRAEIGRVKEDLLAKKKSMDSQIARFRQEYDAYAKIQNQKIDKYRAAIEANRNLLKREIDAMSSQITAKVTELGGYQKTQGEVKRLLSESKGIQISASEKQKWEERLLMLSEKIRPLQEEIQELKLQIRLKKQKISFLK